MVEMIRRNAPLIALAVILVPLLLVRLETIPSAWFDEGYKMNAAYTLAAHGVYGTYTLDGFVPFDPGTSSGPVDLGLTALAFRVFGVGLVQARLVSVLFGLLGAYALYRLAVHVYGRDAAWIVTGVAVLFLPLGATNFVLMSRQVLSEAAAVGLILWGLYLWLSRLECPSGWCSVLAGLLIGAGLLSKTQIAVPLIPALLLVIGLRAFWFRKLPIRESLILVSVLLVIGAWMLIGSVLTPPDIRVQNSRLLLDAIRSNLLTGLFGSTLTTSAEVIAVLMAISGLYAVRHLRRPNRLPTAAVQAEFTIGIIILFTMVWYALLSVGWPRYSYFGLILAAWVAGGIVWRLVGWIKTRWSLPRWLPAAAILAFLFIWNARPLLVERPSDGLNETAAYVRQMIPAGAVIETWDWQLDVFMGNLERIHHPPQEYLFQAIRQFSHDQVPFDLPYDVLQANPDYLIIGPFAEWASIYSLDQVRAHFVQVEQFGSYTIFQRKPESGLGVE